MNKIQKRVRKKKKKKDESGVYIGTLIRVLATLTFLCFQKKKKKKKKRDIGEQHLNGFFGEI